MGSLFCKMIDFGRSCVLDLSYDILHFMTTSWTFLSLMKIKCIMYFYVYHTPLCIIDIRRKWVKKNIFQMDSFNNQSYNFLIYRIFEACTKRKKIKCKIQGFVTLVFCNNLNKNSFMDIWQAIGIKSINKINKAIFLWLSTPTLSLVHESETTRAGGEQRLDDLQVSENESMKKKVLLKRVQMFFSSSSMRNISNSWAHLFPAPLHEQMNSVWGQTWLQEPQTRVQRLNHFSVSSVLIGKTALVIHLPH